MMRIFFLLLIFVLQTSCRKTSDLQKISFSLDSLKTVWMQYYSYKDIREDSLLFLKSFQYYALVKNILYELQNDTLTPRDYETLQNFFNARSCFEKNYFSIKKYLIGIRFKLAMLEQLKRDVSNNVLAREVALNYLQKEKEDLVSFEKQYLTLKNEYLRCSALMKNFFRESLQIFARYNEGQYPHLYWDSVPDLP